jgi:hypothetical protein
VLKFYRSVVLLLVLLIVPQSLEATSYFVDKDHPNAGDNNPGTEDLPWKSIEKAVNTAIAGDTVFFKMASTDYMVNINLNFPNSGTPGHYIVFKAFSTNEKPVWNWGGNNFLIKNKHYITIDGFVIKNMSDGLTTKSGSSNIQLKNNHIIGQGNGNDGELVRITGVNCLISHNEIEKAGHNAIYLTSYSLDNTTSNGTIVEYNYIHDNDYHHGINIFPETDDNNPLHIDSIIIRYNRIETSNWGIYSRYMRAFKIYNNIIYNNNGGVHLGGFDSDNSGAPNPLDPYDGLGAIFANNIILAGIPDYDEEGFENNRINNMVFVNNIISSNHVEAVSYYNRNGGPHPVSNQTIDHNIIDGGIILWGESIYYTPDEWFSAVPNQNMHSLNTDPLLNSSGYDYRWNIPGTFNLQTDSPAIDAGLNMLPFYISDDYINVSRPQGNGWDIGAFETKKDETFLEDKTFLLDDYKLEQNFPNPFNPSTNIKFILAHDQKIKLIVFNTLGESVDILADGFYNAGSYNVTFDARNHSSGIYFYKLEFGTSFLIKKMILLK